MLGCCLDAGKSLPRSNTENKYTTPLRSFSCVRSELTCVPGSKLLKSGQPMCRRFKIVVLTLGQYGFCVWLLIEYTIIIIIILGEYWSRGIGVNQYHSHKVCLHTCTCMWVYLFRNLRCKHHPSIRSGIGIITNSNSHKKRVIYDDLFCRGISYAHHTCINLENKLPTLHPRFLNYTISWVPVYIH